MFEIFNVENGRKFSHTTRLGMEYDKAILERYGVPYVVEYMGEEIYNDEDYDGDE